MRVPISDEVAASVNVATGDLQVVTGGLSAPGIGGDREVGAVYRYDGLNRLISAAEGASGAATLSAGWLYCYDQNGNRVLDTTTTNASTASTHGCGAGTFTANAQYDATNALTRRNGSAAGAFAYDGNGNELDGVGTNTRTGGNYNAKDQLKGVTVIGVGHTFDYAGATNTQRTRADGTTYRNTPLTVSGETTGTSSRYFTREPGGALVSVRDGAGGTSVNHYYVTDDLGSVLAVVDTTGTARASYSYDPYGRSRIATGTLNQPYRFTGGYLDAATGIYKLGARYYDPALGRFTQIDPSGEDPHYTYAANSPVNYTDASGTSFLRKLLVAAVGGVVGAVVYSIPGVGLLAGAVAGACAAGAVDKLLSGGTAAQAGYECAVNAAAVGIGGIALRVLRQTIVPALIRRFGRNR